MQPNPGFPTPRGSGLPGWVIGLIIGAGCFSVAIVGLVVLGVYATLNKRSQPQATLPLSEKYATQNGLAVVHYPADFAARSLDHATIALTRNLHDGSDEVVQVVAIANPITDDLNEFARILEHAMETNIVNSGDTWVETSKKPGACLKHAGLVIDGYFVAQHRTKELVHICTFMNGVKGYELKTIAPEAHQDTERPLLQSIVDATELH